MDLCRICLSVDTKMDVFSLPNELQVDKTVEEVMMFCLNIELCEDSKYGRLLCQSCYSLIIKFYKFKEQALKSDQHLKLLKKFKSEEQNEDKLCYESGHEIENKREFSEFSIKTENDNEDTDFLEELTFEFEEDTGSNDNPTVAIKINRGHKFKKIKGRPRKNPVKPEKSACPVCGKYVKNMKQHLGSHLPEEEKPTCAECGKKFMTVHVLKTHINKAHSNLIKLETCDLCGKRVKNLTIHKGRQHKYPEITPCEFCDKKFSGIKGLEQHLSKHVENKGYFCDECGSGYFGKQALEMHILMKHMRSFQCPKCKQSFYRKYHLERHILRKHDPSSLSDTSEVCPICGKTYRQLKNHILTHQPHSQPKLQCDQCKKVFATARRLQRHKKFVHEIKKARCTICDKEVAHLKAHNIRVHSAKVFACHCCPRRFSRPVLLKLHMLTHTDERPFECSYCGNGYKSKNSLERHIRAVHKGEKNILCQICSKGFFSKNHLELHLISHSEERKFKCSICEKLLKSTQALRLHMDRHRGEKRYQCPDCDMAFVCSSSLKSHRLTHTKEKRHPCRYCDVKFGRSDHRNRHERTAHGNQLENLQKLISDQSNVE